MIERENDHEKGRILVLLCSEMVTDVFFLSFLEKLKKRFPLRICMIAENMAASQDMLSSKGWSSILLERVLEGIDLVLLAGMTFNMMDLLERGLLEKSEVRLLTRCFVNHIEVFLWEEYPWEEAFVLPEPVQKMQEQKKKICDMYRIHFLKKQELMNRFFLRENDCGCKKEDYGFVENVSDTGKRSLYTMEDVITWENSVVISKDSYFTPLAADYIREKKICVKYQ